ncbi:hypothetical protein NQ317_005981 [Molorchus minor]|uniref:Galactose mutarotase n=1 Tax=Molorchus minor TaxID=1323400 RepID=A0ABQ9J4E2_9CUCU|nr:hypothetical protein NQ317_005981 [Molorchus minor]
MSCEKGQRRTQVLLTEDNFGQIKGKNGETKPVKRFTWTNSNNVSVQLITYGGYITSIKVPDNRGKIEDVVIGFNDLEGYLSPHNRFFGATVGRVANRIGGARMTIEGITYNVSANNGPNQLHGGFKGFDKVVWEHYVKGRKVILTYHSADLEEGHPGDVLTTVTFELTENNELVIDYSATTTKPTCVNLTNHSYFNLAGNGAGAAGLYQHVVSLNADRITETNAGIPTGKILPVSGSIFDLRLPKVLGDILNNVPGQAGFDNNFCVIKGLRTGKSFCGKKLITLKVEGLWRSTVTNLEYSSTLSDSDVSSTNLLSLNTSTNINNTIYFSLSRGTSREWCFTPVKPTAIHVPISSLLITSIQLINYGGYITSIKVPDKKRNVEDIVIGFDTLEGYQRPENMYFGSTIGRFANRIGKSKITVEGTTYQLSPNNGPNHLHGGIKGFDKVIWEYYVRGNQVTLSYHSPDLEEGYPGNVVASVVFELTDNDEFLMDYSATTTKPTIVNMTNHSYFNLAGHSKGSTELYKHVISINADRVTEVDSQGIPTGKLPSVSGTAFDLRIPRVIGDVIKKVPNSPGYDHNYCVSRGTEQVYSFVAKVLHPDSGRVFEVYSNQPGVQFYTGNFLPDDDSLKGKGGSVYRKHGAFCLETQMIPDTINHNHFGNAVLYPGERYHHAAKFKFLIENNN